MAGDRLSQASWNLRCAVGHEVRYVCCLTCGCNVGAARAFAHERMHPYWPMEVIRMMPVTIRSFRSEWLLAKGLNLPHGATARCPC